MIIRQETQGAEGLNFEAVDDLGCGTRALAKSRQRTHPKTAGVTIATKAME